MSKVVGPFSLHYDLSEFVVSETAARHGIDNAPPLEAIRELRRLCMLVLDPMRERLGVRVRVTSGYRCHALNALLPGSSKTSAHQFGRAADVVPLGGMSVEDAFAIVRMMPLPFDQLIYECGTWLHVGIAPVGTEPRRQVMTGSKASGKWVYASVS